MSGTSTPTTDLLLQHVDWLRDLARSLVRDADVADELTQETVVRALEQPPRDAGKLRNWLAKVMRNLLSERYRSQRNRAVRERETARPDRLPPTDELVERVHAQRELADALLALEEPFRTTVMLRFYEGLPPRKIAARQGVPIATVKSRLHRGLVKLREDLDRSYGSDRRAWMCALLPLAVRVKPVAVATTLGGIAVNAKLWIAATAVIALGAYFVWPQQSQPAQPDSRLVTAGPNDRDRDGRPESNDTPAVALGAGGRADVASSARDATAATEVSTHRVEGRVVDGDGIGVAGLALSLAEPSRGNSAGGEEASVKSGPNGFIAFDTRRKSLRLEVGDPDWVTVRAGSWRASATIAPVVVAAKAIDIGGRVVDELGNSLAEVRLGYALPADFRTRFRDVLDASFQPDWSAQSAADGKFALDQIPSVSGAILQATCEGFEPAVIDLPNVSVHGLEIRLARIEAAAGPTALHGRVVRANGEPAAAARVACGTTMTRTNDRGFFAIDLQRAGDAEDLLAVEVGAQSARVRLPESTQEFVTMRLGPPTRTLSGRVLGPDGEPIADARVLLADPTRFGIMGMLPLHTEGLAAGKPLPPFALESATWQLSKYRQTTGSARPVTTSNAMVAWVVTDTMGRFSLDGLEDRAYRLRVIDDALRFAHVTEPLQAGRDDAEVRLPEPNAWPEVRGRVITRHGDPVPGVSIIPYLPVLNDEVSVPGGRAQITRWLQTQAVVCADDGSFVMRNVPKQALQFYLISDQILPFYAGVEHIVDPTDVVIPVTARAHIELELSTPALADAIRVEDYQGATVQILRMRADGHTNDTVLPLQDGKSGVVTVTSDAALIRLLKDGVEVDSIQVQLRPGAVQRIRH